MTSFNNPQKNEGYPPDLRDNPQKMAVIYKLGTIAGLKDCSINTIDSSDNW
jgi:hypothetical protein